MMLTAMALAWAAQGCRTLDTDLPRPLAGWTRLGSTLDTGHAVIVPRRGERAVTSVRIRRAGTFGIAIEGNGWVDVTPQGAARPLRMAAERHGPRCSTLGKIVAYRLRPGTYRVSVGRLRADRVRMMLVAGPSSPMKR